jgi:hypothetical protein
MIFDNTNQSSACASRVSVRWKQDTNQELANRLEVVR